MLKFLQMKAQVIQYRWKNYILRKDAQEQLIAMRIQHREKFIAMLYTKATTIQSVVRTYFARKEYCAMILQIKCASLIQAVWRKYALHRMLRQMKEQENENLRIKIRQQCAERIVKWYSNKKFFFKLHTTIKSLNYFVVSTLLEN